MTGGKRRRARSQSKNTFIYITWITSAIKNLFGGATVPIRLVLTPEAASPLSAPSSPFQFEVPDCPLRISASHLPYLFLFCLFFVNNIKTDPNRRSRRPESAELGGGWIGSVAPAAAVGSGTLLVFSGSGIWTPPAAAAGRSFQFNVSSRSVSFEVANEKVSECADHR